jgi:hypothetical protein
VNRRRGGHSGPDARRDAVRRLGVTEFAGIEGLCVDGLGIEFAGI